MPRQLCVKFLVAVRAFKELSPFLDGRAMSPLFLALQKYFSLVSCLNHIIYLSTCAVICLPEKGRSHRGPHLRPIGESVSGAFEPLEVS